MPNHPSAAQYAELEIHLYPAKGEKVDVQLILDLPGKDGPAPLLENPVTVRFSPILYLGGFIDGSRYGQELKESFFKDIALRSAWREAQRRASDKDLSLRVRLSIDGRISKYHNLRWETLHDPDNHPLFISENILFSRFVFSESGPGPQPGPKGDLRALIAIANPQELNSGNQEAPEADGRRRLAPVPVKEEQARAQSALAGIDFNVYASDKQTRVTLNGLANELRSGNYSILYLVCHGALLPDRKTFKAEPYLWLEGEDGTTDRVQGERFVQFLRGLKQKPRLIVLASCESAGTGRSDDRGALAALGPRLAQIGVPAVLAMQGSVQINTVAKFMPRFFEELQRDGQIDRAVSAARAGIIANTPDWFMPVLYLGIQSGLLWLPDEEGKLILPPPLPVRPNWVGRTQELQKLKQRLLSASGSRITTLLQMPGVGKTELAAHLANDQEVRIHFKNRVFLVTLGKDLKKSDHKEWEVGESDFKKAKMKELDLKEVLGNWAISLGMTTESLTNLTTIEARVMAIRQFIGDKPMLLIVDDVWNTEHAQMFLVFGKQCKYIFTTRFLSIASALSDADTSNSHDDFPILKELSDSDGFLLLQQVAPQAIRTRKDRDDAAALVRSVGGLPLAIILMGTYLKLATALHQSRAIQQALVNLRQAKERLALKEINLTGRLSDTPRSLTAVIGMSEDALPDDETRRVFRAVSIFRSKPGFFSIKAANAVCQVEDENVLYNQLRYLSDSGLVDSLPDPEPQESIPDEDFDWNELDNLEEDEEEEEDPYTAEQNSEKFAMSPTIADFAREKLDLQQAEEYHNRATDYYQCLLRAYEENHIGGASAYERMYSYEHPAWQRIQSAMLYHLGKGSHDYAILYLVRTYLDAFWWWGCYCKFPFCEKLIADWHDEPLYKENHAWLDLITDFHQSYPTGYEKRGKGNWQKVEKSLISLREVCKVNGQLTDLIQIEDTDQPLRDAACLHKDPNALRVHIRGLTDIFLAEALRYQNMNDPRIEIHYNEAYEIFNTTEDSDGDWNKPWVLCHLGDLHLEIGQYEKSRHEAAGARRQAIEGSEDATKRDYEVMAISHRIEADAYWQQNELDHAFFHDSRAIFYAYVFQVYPAAHDFYTRSLYQEMTERTLNRLNMLYTNGQKEAFLRAGRYLYHFWQPYWVASGSENDKEHLFDGGWENMVAYLFPPSPADQDLEDGEHSGYYMCALQVIDSMLNSVEEEWQVGG